jgi:dihydrofolate synthase/folylpolyglutamate synthase
MAFLHFAEPAIEIAVLEVGMGGRLDATNVVDPMISIITDISLDHMEWLGSTVAEIAREKAGILRRGGTLITLPQHPEANQAIGEIATSLSVLGVSAVPFLPVSDTAERSAQPTPEKATTSAYTLEVLGRQVEIDSPLRGAHQHRNVALAIAAAVELAISHGFPVSANSIADGVHNTRWPARLERITTPSSKGDGSTQWLLDVAHNPAGAWALRAGLRDLFPDQLMGTLVFSCLRDKPVLEMAQILFPLFRRIIFAPIYSSRATPMRDLLASASSTGTPAVAAASVGQSIDLALEHAEQESGVPIVVSGSVYLVGDVRARLLSRQAQSASTSPQPERVGQMP